MRVSVEELRAISERIFQHLQAQGVNEIEIPVDYYWDVPRALRYDPYHPPAKLDLGQLSDDWAELTKLAGSEGRPVGYALVWLGAVLRAAGEEVVA